MKPSRRWIQALNLFWPIVLALLAIATVSHDVAMAAYPHDVSTASSPMHAVAGIHESMPRPERAAHQPATGPICPTDSCPKLVDCGVARVSNPIPAPDHPSATCAVVAPVIDPDPTARPGSLAFSLTPVQPPGVRRALLQVFLN